MINDKESKFNDKDPDPENNPENNDKEPENNPENNDKKQDKNVFSLQNVSNYKEKLEDDCSSIIEKYLQIILQYLKQITENTKIKNNQHFFFILMKGLDALYYVFLNILMYTRNLNIAYYNTQKAYYYYIEFIEQINNRNRNSLNLNSKDAIMYVYQKTIFEINNEIKMEIKINKEERDIYDSLFAFHKIYKILFKSFYDKYNINLLVNKNETEDIVNKLNDTMKNIKSIKNDEYLDDHLEDYLNEIYDKITDFIESTENKTEKENSYKKIIEFISNINEII